MPTAVPTIISFAPTETFVGKVSGSTVENPHTTKVNSNSSTTLQAPNGTLFELNSGDYGLISSLNSGVKASTGTLNNSISQQIFSFNLIEAINRKYGAGTVQGADTAAKVAWLKANVTKLTANWHGFGSSPAGNKATLAIWNVSTNAWDNSIIKTNAAVDKYTHSEAGANTPGYVRLDANGFVHFLAYADASNGTIASTINTDYVELVVELKYQINVKSDWTSEDKINFDDFNRIEVNYKEVADFLGFIQYVLPTLSVTTNRTISSIDFLSSINRIEQNLETIRNNFVTPPDYLPLETWSIGKGFDYTDANRLETNLKLLLDYGVLVYQSYRYCGAAIAGETGVVY